MAKLTDKFFNRVIEGDLELSSADKSNNGITKVVANPTLAGTEAGLEGLEVSGTKYSVKKGAVAGVEGAPSGTLATVLGLDSNGKLAKGSVSGGTQLYKHIISITGTGVDTLNAYVINKSSSKITSYSQIYEPSGQNFVPLYPQIVSKGTSQVYGFILSVVFAGMGFSVKQIVFDSTNNATFVSATYNAVNETNDPTPL